MVSLDGCKMEVRQSYGGEEVSQQPLSMMDNYIHCMEPAGFKTGCHQVQIAGRQTIWQELYGLHAFLGGFLNKIPSRKQDAELEELLV